MDLKAHHCSVVRKIRMEPRKSILLFRNVFGLYKKPSHQNFFFHLKKKNPTTKGGRILISLLYLRGSTCLYQTYKAECFVMWNSHRIQMFSKSGLPQMSQAGVSLAGSQANCVGSTGAVGRGRWILCLAWGWRPSGRLYLAQLASRVPFLLFPVLKRSSKLLLVLIPFNCLFEGYKHSL